jgi:Dockerin type I domain
MSKTIRAHRIAHFARLLPLAAAALLATLPAAVPAQVTQGQAAVGLPVTQAATIVSGQTSASFKLPVSALASMRLQVTVPVPGVTLTVLNPQGQTVFAPGDASVGFLDGAALTPPLPGGQFLTPDIATPANGEWTVRADFPASPHPTVALLTTYAQSSLQVGLVLSSNVYRVGNPVPLGLLVVNNGQPVTGLTPRISISKDGAAPVVLDARDSGQAADYDGLAGDGIYSQGTVFTDPGSYQLLGEASIPQAGGGVAQRSAQAVLQIVPANYQLGSISGSVTNGSGGCVATLHVDTAGSASLAGTYATAATLKSPSGRTLVKRSSAALDAPGAVNTRMSFNAAEIRSQFGEGGVFSVDPLDVLSFIAGQPWLELRKAAAFSFASIALNQLCADPIEINSSATVASGLRGRFIGQLNFTLPIRVTTAGSYQVSFKVIDNKGVEVGQFGLAPSLLVGANNVNASVLADRLQVSDGPFTIDSVLVVGSGNRSAQASRVPVTASDFSRWQFFPTITGDLNGDGAVGAPDRDIVTQSRGQVPRVPGDRRDLNGDGKIDLLDAREVVNRQCAAGSCPRN